jgi:hypothetical protein
VVELASAGASWIFKAVVSCEISSNSALCLASDAVVSFTVAETVGAGSSLIVLGTSCSETVEPPFGTMFKYAAYGLLLSAIEEFRE